MPYKDKEKKKEYDRLYREKNKEKMRLYRLGYKENKEKKSERNKLYRQTDQGKKSNTIWCWKSRGIICFDYELLHEIYKKTTNCEFCDIELTTDRYNTSTTKCLDHDHSINDMFNVRGVLCHSCNVKDVLK